MNSIKKLKISLLVFVGIFFCFLFFVYLPLFSKIQKNTEELALERDNYFFLEKKKIGLENTRKNYGEFKERVKRIESLFLEYGNPVEFLDYLERMSELYGISPRISNLYFKEGSKEEMPTLTLNISFVSEFSEFSKLLANLKLAPWLLQIQSLDSLKTKDGIQTSVLLRVFCKENAK